MSDPLNLEHLRHSLAHLLAAAVMDLYPDTKRTIGPAIDNGFYFDFAFSKPISESDLEKIEVRMRELQPTWTSCSRHELNPEQAKAEYPGNEYKHELIDEIVAKGEPITFYKSGEYWDLCRGGHIDDLSVIDPESYHLVRLAGAYWRGDEKNTMLTRIYGHAFATKEERIAYESMLEEAAKRDHRILGKQLDLFVFSDLVGPGLPLWTPKGTILRHELDQFVWELRKARGYERVEIPHITKKDLYETSGHWSKFSDELFRITTREEHEFAMKPMNCPHHTQIYDRKQWSYRELPQRYANTTMCYRDEQTGELNGLGRVRAFTQDDAHVFCRMSQAKAEFLKVWDIVDAFYGAFGFELRVRLSMRDPQKPDSYLGKPEQWEEAQAILKEIAAERNIETFEGIGEAAFYGPKLDFMAKDAIGRSWQVATIQFDFNMPERFDLSCINESGEHERIVMIHAAIMGSIERFMNVLIEHVAGAFPFWLAPVQVRVLPVSDKFSDYAQTIIEQLRAHDIRAELSQDDSLGKRIRASELDKVPHTIVIGEKEVTEKTVSVRNNRTNEQEVLALDTYIDQIVTATKNRS